MHIAIATVVCFHDRFTAYSQTSYAVTLLKTILATCIAVHVVCISGIAIAINVKTKISYVAMQCMHIPMQ